MSNSIGSAEGRSGEDASCSPESFIDHYLDGPYAEFQQEHRHGGTFGITMMEVRQAAIETTDPAVPEFMFVAPVGVWEPVEADFGDGWRRHERTGPSVDIQPADTECRFRLPDLHLRVAVIDSFHFVQLLDGEGLTPTHLMHASNAFVAAPLAEACHRTMWHALAHAGPGSNLMLDGAFLQMIGALLAAGGHGNPLTSVATLGDRRLSRAVDYTEAHLAEPLTVGEIARAAGMSASHFSASFKAATGETVWQFVQQRRFARALGLVETTDWPLARIAHACGFADASHLVRTFRRQTGRTPGSERAR